MQPLDQLSKPIARAPISSRTIYGCSICGAFSTEDKPIAEAHINEDNKGKRRDSQWRSELTIRQEPRFAAKLMTVVFRFDLTQFDPESLTPEMMLGVLRNPQGPLDNPSTGVQAKVVDQEWEVAA
jgi:hypothetical protein